MPALGVGLSACFTGTPPAARPDPDVDALIARMDVAPNAARGAHIARLVAALKAISVWQTLDAMWMMAAHHPQAACLNWVGPALGLTPVAGPDFAVDRGYKGDGVGAYLAIDGAASAYSRFLPRDASMGLWASEIIQVEIAIAMGTAHSNMTHISPHSTSVGFGGRMNYAAGGGVSEGGPYDGLGIIHLTREPPSGAYLYRRQSGRIRSTFSAVPQIAVPPTRLLSGNTSSSVLTYSTCRLAFAYVGSSLTSNQELAMDAALTTYMAAITAA